MKNVVFNREENGFIFLDSTIEINLDNAVELCREYKLKDGGYIFVSYEDGYYSIKREEDGVVLDLFDNDDEIVKELGYLMISALDFEDYL